MPKPAPEAMRQSASDNQCGKPEILSKASTCRLRAEMNKSCSFRGSDRRAGWPGSTTLRSKCRARRLRCPLLAANDHDRVRAAPAQAGQLVGDREHKIVVAIAR